LQALREKRSIALEDVDFPSHSISSLNRHLVVCEEGEELSQSDRGKLRARDWGWLASYSSHNP
jgi:hypothetical protein